MKGSHCLDYKTSWSSNAKLQQYSCKTNTYGKISSAVNAIEIGIIKSELSCSDVGHPTKLSYSYLMNI